jgi:hypothetical protein
LGKHTVRRAKGRGRYTDKKKIKFSSYTLLGKSEGSGAKSCMTNDLLVYGENFCAFPHIRKPFLIYDIAPDPI